MILGTPNLPFSLKYLSALIYYKPLNDTKFTKTDKYIISSSITSPFLRL